MTRPQLLVLAGPNGAGKSTFYDSHLHASPLPFLNADLVAARTGIGSGEAAALLDVHRDLLVQRGHGFITETVFSDPVGAKLDLLRRAMACGFDVILIYIGIDERLCSLRVEQRVAHGGHDVPRERIAPRFKRSLANLRTAIGFVPLVKVYDNSHIDDPHRLIARFEAGRRTFMSSPLPRWARSLRSRPRGSSRR
jgi:predicted ABC-type ATPase